MSEKVQCPNCLGEAEKTGNKITCLACDAIFEIKRTGAASVVKIGELEELKDRVSQLEAQLAPKLENDDDPAAANNDVDDDDEPSIG